MHRAAILLTALLLAPAALGQDSPGNEEKPTYLPLLETLIDHVGEGRIDDAVSILVNDTTKGVPESSQEDLKRTLSTIYGRGGKYGGQEVVTIRPLSGRLHRVYAVAYHQRQPLVYTFTMYRFDGEWKIHHVHWDDNVAKLADVVDSSVR